MSTGQRRKTVAAVGDGGGGLEARRLKECLMRQTSRVGAIISIEGRGGGENRGEKRWPDVDGGNEPREIVIQRGGTLVEAKFEFKAGRSGGDQGTKASPN